MVAVSFLRSIPYFKELDDAQLRQVASLVQERTLTRGQVILTEGTPGDGLYFVIMGRVKVFRMSPEGRQQVLRVMGPAETFNDVPAFDAGPNPANVEAMETTIVGVLSTASVLRLVEQYPSFSLGMLRILAGRLRMLVTLVSDLSLLNVEGRVAKVLLAYAEMAPEREPALRLTQQDLAAMVGTAREVVARALRSLEESGAIRRDEGHIRVLDRKALANALSDAAK